MPDGFRLLGAAHFAILAAIPCAAGVLAWVARRSPAITRKIAGCLGLFLAANEVIWYAWRLHTEGFRFPDGLPLELCDLTLWLTVACLLTLASSSKLQPTVFEFTWLVGLAGSAMAVITPDLWAAPLSYPTVYFFLAHGGVIAALLYLVWAGLARPRPGCVWRALGLLNAYALLIGIFNALFHTNYMYLCQKPSSVSLLNFFGPWPYYILGGELAAVVLSWLLWMPFSAADLAHRTRRRSLEHRL